MKHNLCNIFFFPSFQSCENHCKTFPLYVCNFLGSSFLPLSIVSAQLLFWILESLWCSSGYIPKFSNFFQSLLSPSAPKLGMSLICEVLNNSIPCLCICSLFSSLSGPFIWFCLPAFFCAHFYTPTQQHLLALSLFCFKLHFYSFPNTFATMHFSC